MLKSTPLYWSEMWCLTKENVMSKDTLSCQNKWTVATKKQIKNSKTVTVQRIWWLEWIQHSWSFWVIWWGWRPISRQNDLHWKPGKENEKRIRRRKDYVGLRLMDIRNRKERDRNRRESVNITGKLIPKSIFIIYQTVQNYCTNFLSPSSIKTNTNQLLLFVIRIIIW